jgi:RimJ/RimL family protein N-acetyltransferase
VFKIPPLQVRTARLWARCWEPAHAALLKDAIDSSLIDLGQWTPWVIPQPNEISVLQERIDKFREQFGSGQSFIYGLFDRDEGRVVGQAGLYGRIGPAALEIGYWIRSDASGQGYATEAARMLTDVAFRECAVDRVEIRCDPDNAASAAIPRRLGFHFREVLKQEAVTPAEGTHDLQIWELLSAQYERRARAR